MDKHIFPRHIEQTAEWKKENKSRYIFGAAVYLAQWLGIPAKQGLVQQADQATFDYGTAHPTYRNGKLSSVAYTISWPSVQTPQGPLFLAFGEDNTGRFVPKGSKTNTNTVVVDGDCKTVITSHPGIPNNVDRGSWMTWDSDPSTIWSAW